ncbi:CaiB/BaiF CoA-transferase family protein [Acuticoccus sp. I52.16.1]|uniref:CaiB/BaiF CoA transferase family protein n=1 Tax=Acuticoccus sp. I52.16.1 TaxID=2928472 RepID=UPI001FD6273D|nr:CaiB/BaiF CoA-transferase family protein [Acuticoccus sp. I52.16.1]UOM37258.1 CoA transferase [Acuticoccus sp. I52.16.1]
MGPLHGVKVVEIAGIGPAPFCAMMLADMGAEVLRVDRPDAVTADETHRFDVLNRGRRSIVLDLKHPAGRDAALALAAQADVVIEGFRPGVMESLGLAPDICHAHNPALVYGRMTGWGQDGPLARAAGHDINYIALSGVLWSVGRKGEAPVPPLNLVGDFGGGAMYLAFGIVCALIEARASGRGQVVDAAMVDGASSLIGMIHGLTAGGRWTEARGENIVDTGAPWYDVYETADGRHVAIGAIEPKFYAQMLTLLGLDPASLPAQYDTAGWPLLRRTFAAHFRSATREEWCRRMEGSDACFAPVLSPSEARAHPHMVAREAFLEVDGVAQPAAAPRFSRSTPAAPTPPRAAGADTRAALGDWGFDAASVDALLASGAAIQR